MLQTSKYEAALIWIASSAPLFLVMALSETTEGTVASALAAFNALGFAYFTFARTKVSRWLVMLSLTTITLTFAGAFTFFAIIASSDDALIVVEDQAAVLKSSMAWTFGFIVLEILCVVWFRRAVKRSA